MSHLTRTQIAVFGLTLAPTVCVKLRCFFFQNGLNLTQSEGRTGELYSQQEQSALLHLLPINFPNSLS